MEIEFKNSYSRTLDHVDRPYIEQRLYEMEEELYEPTSSIPSLKPVTSILKDFQSDMKCVGVVFLGEGDCFSHVMNSALFVPRSRMPIESQIFEATRVWGPNGVQGWDREFMGTFTPKNYKPNMSSAHNIPLVTSTQGSLFPGAIPRQTSPPLTPSSKRRKTTSSTGEESE
ncbi:hypothetical protein MMC13_004739 [Lambiella insularis]|nr:hypothetical protein [Lambiella insularis]